MRVFIDTNIFVASITEEPQRGDIATEFLNAEARFEPYTSLINVMELRTVLTKKKARELERANQAISRITDDVDLLIPDGEDLVNANVTQQETLLYPIDALLLSFANDLDATLVTFDGELLEHGGALPSDVLEQVA